jgi:predicted NAD-dependent protein-ADP-ribosyltransferase YbiA (DUF1768 family)
VNITVVCTALASRPLKSIQSILIIQMETVIWHKFTQHRSLKEELLATGDAKLIEASIRSNAMWQLLLSVFSAIGF